MTKARYVEDFALIEAKAKRSGISKADFVSCYQERKWLVERFYVAPRGTSRSVISFKEKQKFYIHYLTWNFFWPDSPYLDKSFDQHDRRHQQFIRFFSIIFSDDQIGKMEPLLEEFMTWVNKREAMKERRRLRKLDSAYKADDDQELEPKSEDDEEKDGTGLVKEEGEAWVKAEDENEPLPTAKSTQVFEKDTKKSEEVADWRQLPFFPGTLHDA